MGVTVVQHYPMTENRTGPQVIEFLTKRVQAMGAIQAGPFLVDCETYMSVPSFDYVHFDTNLRFTDQRPDLVHQNVTDPSEYFTYLFL